MHSPEHQFTNAAALCRKLPKQMRALAYTHFHEHLVTNTFLLMPVVMRVKPLYLLLPKPANGVGSIRGRE
jgi:hypothetical protein